MQRNLIFLLGVLIILLAGAVVVLLLRGQLQPPPVSINAADENAADPYHQEMECIDRLLQRNDLDANQVEPALAGCRGRTSTNQEAGR